MGCEDGPARPAGRVGSAAGGILLEGLGWHLAFPGGEEKGSALREERSMADSA